MTIISRWAMMLSALREHKPDEPLTARLPITIYGFSSLPLRDELLGWKRGFPFRERVSPVILDKHRNLSCVLCHVSA